ncbi:hypothetical protein OIE61_01625 [Streptomyces sp. NBC_01762]|uniref:hypothetical protein n=1 Tax=Streptomyces sp. NBC_01762 TaxID=2975933 RepID=UPI002DDC4429|nr:hypothetical protein [Streptomyces sp. NBC_01762]WSC42801.1 hypothetical protein OIE61_01625 [Streptomyces sp. NBC_01762]
MAERTPGKDAGPERLSADRLHTGRPGPSNIRIRLARAQDTAVAGGLLGTAGVQIIPALRSAIEDGTAGSALLGGLSGTTKIIYTATATARPPMRPGSTPTPHALRAARLRPDRGRSLSGTAQQLDDSSSL